MSKSVLLSIKPKYCELIASGKKTIEVRKTKPKLDTPFKCYIYCTKDFYRAGDGYFQGKYCGKVIGEFVCDKIDEIRVVDTELMRYVTVNDKADMFISEETCLSVDELYDYLWPQKGYGFHISDLIIYDKPKELREFWQCGGTFNVERDNIDNIKIIGGKAYKPITRPPQSWCYVQELR